VTAARPLHLSTPSSHDGPRGGLRRRGFNFRGRVRRLINVATKISDGR